MTTWRGLISEEMRVHGETFDDVVSMCACTNNWKREDRQTFSDESWLDIEFDDSYGGTEGPLFTLWTQGRVYFPICYDGSEWVGSASREPDGKPMEHQGGG